jgi:hypothetical protein
MTEYPIVLKCLFCNGTGEKTSSVGDSTAVNVCGACSGEGFIAHARLRYPVNIIPAYAVFEAADFDELDSLSAAKVRDLNSVLASGFVDVSVGSNAIGLLNGVFGESSTTMTNIAGLR